MYIYIGIYVYIKNLFASAGDIRDAGTIPGSWRPPGAGHSNPPQYSCLENSMDRGAWWATIHRVAKSQTLLKQLSMRACTHMHTHTHTHICSAGKEPAWNVGDLGSIFGLGRSPGIGKSYPLQYSGLENPMENPMGCKESDMTEWLSLIYNTYTQYIMNISGNSLEIASLIM